MLAYATTIVYSNFFVIDGAHKDPTTGVWHPWSVTDFASAHSARLDLRRLESAAALELETLPLSTSDFKNSSTRHPPRYENAIRANMKI